MSVATKFQPVRAGLITLGDGIYLGLPRPHLTALPAANGYDQSTVSSTSPHVILIFGWMGAQLRHLQSYTREYSKLYPNATQILVKCDPSSFFWSSHKSAYACLIPVAEALEALGCVASEKHDALDHRPRVLTHVFSNGGSLQLTALSQLLAKRTSGATAEPFQSAIIFDSCPAESSYRTLGVAFSFAIRNRLFRIGALAIVYTMHIFALLRLKLFGTKMLMTKMRESLLNPRVLPWMSVQTPRLYVYSKKDDLIPWQQVESHVEASRKLGLDVRTEMFENSAHVAHMRAEPDRYWSVVMKIWKDACNTSTSKDKTG